MCRLLLTGVSMASSRKDAAVCESSRNFDEDELSLAIYAVAQAVFSVPPFMIWLSGTFNDSLCKQSLGLAILYRITTQQEQSPLVNLCLCSLPFFLFSAFGRQLGEKAQRGMIPSGCEC